MSDAWLEHGHETDGSDLTPVFSSSSVLTEEHTGAATSSRPTWTSGWRAVMAGGGLALFATLGVVGVANAIGDNLFPSMGSTSPASVWQNPVPPAEPTVTTVVVPTTATTNQSTVPSTVPSTTPTTSATTVPSSKAPVPPSSSVTTAVSPTTSTLDQRDDDPVDDDPVDDSGGSSGSGSDDAPDDADDVDADDADRSGRDDSDDD